MEWNDNGKVQKSASIENIAFGNCVCPIALCIGYIRTDFVDKGDPENFQGSPP